MLGWGGGGGGGGEVELQQKNLLHCSHYIKLLIIIHNPFSRGRGPLKNTMDVINAAKKISEAGTKLDVLCKQIADQVCSQCMRKF